MTTVKINCPKCSGAGLTGTVQEVVCTQCKGTGVVSVNDTDTVATVQTALMSQSNFVVSAPTPVPPAAVKVLTRGK